LVGDGAQEDGEDEELHVTLTSSTPRSQNKRNPKETPLSSKKRTAAHELTIFVQAQIVGIGEGFDLDKLYIVCEGTVLCTIPHQRIVDSIVALLSSFDIFNMVYKDSKAILSFLEQALMGIGRVHTLPSINTLFIDISDL